MKASKLLVTLLFAGLVLSTGCSSTSKGFSSEGNSLKIDYTPLLSVDQPKPVVEVGQKVPFNKTTGVNVKNLIHVSQDLPTFRVGTSVLNEGPFGVSVKDGGLTVKVPFVQLRIPYPKIKKGE